MRVNEFSVGEIPLLVRRGGCAGKKKPRSLEAAQTGWSLTGLFRE